MTDAIRAQSYQERPPVAALAPWVSSVWHQSVSPEHPPYWHRTVPNGSVDVVWSLGSAPRIVGPRTVPHVELLPPGSTVVGVRLGIGAAPAVLGVPMSELLDRELDARELWGTRPTQLVDELAERRSAAMASAMLERAVLGRVDRASVIDPLVAEMVRNLASRRLERIGTLPGRLHVSERQLNRRCLAATGLGPKTLHRTLRFQRFLALAHAGGLTRASLSRLAAAAGYTDQPHLSRECARLTGVSPRTLLRDAETHCAGAHDHAPSYAPLLTQDV